MTDRERTKKIAFVGTSCTGKTTLFECYRDRYSGDGGALFVEEASRAYFQDNPNIEDRFSVRVQGEIQQLALRSEMDARRRGANVVFCDRSVVDAVAYVWASGDIGSVSPRSSNYLIVCKSSILGMVVIRET